MLTLLMLPNGGQKNVEMNGVNWWMKSVFVLEEKVRAAEWWVWHDSDIALMEMYIRLNLSRENGGISPK